MQFFHRLPQIGDRAGIRDDIVRQRQALRAARLGRQDGAPVDDASPLLPPVSSPGVSSTTQAARVERIEASPTTRDQGEEGRASMRSTVYRSRIGGAGFDGFLSKPVNLKDFVSTVQRMLGEGTP